MLLDPITYFILSISFASHPESETKASPPAHFSGTLTAGCVSVRLTNELYAAKQPTATRTAQHTHDAMTFRRIMTTTLPFRPLADPQRGIRAAYPKMWTAAE